MADMRPLDAEEQRVANELSVTIVKAGKGHEGKIFSLSSGRLGVCFDSEEDPVLEVGDVVELRLDSPSILEEFSESCRVCHRETIGGGCLYGYAITDWNNFLAHLATRSEKYNRRASHRVVPGGEVDVLISVEGLDAPVHATLLDLSQAGCSFRVDQSFAKQLGDSSLVEVWLSLPGVAERISFHAQIRNHEDSAEGVRFGVQFDVNRTENYHEKKTALGAYVAELLRSVQDYLMI